MPNRIPSPIWTPRNRDYHGTLDRWSSSSLKTFRRSPALAFRRYIERSIAAPRPTPPMILGTLVNLMLLEPESVGSEIFVVDVASKNTKAYREAEVEHGASKTVVILPEFEAAEAISDSILRPQSRHAEVALELLTSDGGFSEYAHRWTDPATGVPCRMMLDRLPAAEGDVVTVVELKTTVDPTPAAFQRQFFAMEYHCQAAFNARGVADLVGAVGDPFFHVRYLVVAVGNEAPHSVGVHLLSPETLAAGSAIVTRDLAKLAECLAGRAPWRGGWEDAELIPFLRPPAWYRVPDDAVDAAASEAPATVEEDVLGGGFESFDAF